jgi:hypothetical protein
MRAPPSYIIRGILSVRASLGAQVGKHRTRQYVASAWREDREVERIFLCLREYAALQQSYRNGNGPEHRGSSGSEGKFNKI